LNDFVAEDGTVMHPPVNAVFWSFRVMVATGMAMLLVAWAGVWLMWRRGADALPRPYLMGVTAMTFAGWLATLAGWYTTEIGRQPWLVQGVLTTKDAVGDIAAGMVLSTLLAYLAIYVALLAAYIGVIFHLARKGNAPSAVAAPMPNLQPAE
jgi:cytochrome d ubiquinol oxidase subunit I